MVMKRTTIMADERILERLRLIAHREEVSLAEVIRQGLRLRVDTASPRLHFLAVGRSWPGTGPSARDSADAVPQARPWR